MEKSKNKQYWVSSRCFPLLSSSCPKSFQCHEPSTPFTAPLEDPGFPLSEGWRATRDGGAHDGACRVQSTSAGLADASSSPVFRLSAPSDTLGTGPPKIGRPHSSSHRRLGVASIATPSTAQHQLCRMSCHLSLPVSIFPPVVPTPQPKVPGWCPSNFDSWPCAAEWSRPICPAKLPFLACP